MTASIQALLAGLVDYAGLFPPAKLPLEQAVTNYARYRKGSDAWMLGRFICPAGSLKELEPLCRSLFDEEHPLTVSALATNSGSLNALWDTLQTDLRAIDEVRHSQAGRMQIDVMEMRLPMEIVRRDEDKIADVLADISKLLRRNGQSLRPFFEVSISNGGRDSVSRIVRAIQSANKRLGLPAVAGFKLRCGGLEKSAFPSVELVSHSLMECLLHEAPFKATAGLHHPLRRYEESVGTTMHGFVNVFGAGVLAHSLYQSGSVADDVKKLLGRILNDDNAEDFHFEKDGFRWQSYFAPVQDIEACRRSFLVSFGSCSFDEPRDDLRALGWLQDRNVMRKF